MIQKLVYSRAMRFGIVRRQVFVGVVLLCKRSGAFATSGGIKHHQRYHLSTYLKNSNVNGDGNSPREGGKTGWNHNLPHPESDFWDSSKGDSAEATSSSNTDEAPLRTGWLHNTESPSEKAARAQAEKPAPTTSAARRRLELAMKQQARNHRILQPPTKHANGKSVMIVTEHMISLPIDRSAGGNSKERVDVYFSVVEAYEAKDEAFWNELMELSPQKRADRYVQYSNLANAESLVLYLQGGPGFGAPTPVVGLGLSSDSSWAAKALEQPQFSRIVLMDQRGTGRSTPITKQTLELQFPELLSDSPSELVFSAATEYVSKFRADSIVADAEEIRDALLIPMEDAADELYRPWGCSVGQSFGGFCTLTYLSQVQYPPRICLLTGGIPPVLSPVDEVYTSLWHRVQERSILYYEMYPGDIPLVKQIVRLLIENPVPMPSGGTLTARRFLQLGLALGGSPSSFASLHRLFQSALVPTGDGQWLFSRAFLKEVEMEQSFDDAPVYFWLHEAIYANQAENAPTNWSAHRQLERLMEAPDSLFDYTRTSQESCPDPVLFFGEMVFPWMSEDYGELKGLEPMAEAIAQKSDWGSIYDPQAMEAALTNGRSKAAAAVYYDDMYVDFDACARVFKGPLAKAKVWITNDYQHSGLRDDGSRIFEKLLGMAEGRVRTPS